MLGDAKKYDAYMAQQEAQKQRMMDEQAGQQRLPIDMPVSRNRLELTDDETRLASISNLLICTIILMLHSARSGGSEEQSQDRAMEIVDKYERELITLHRAIVAKAVNEAKQPLPSAGSF